MTHDHVVKSAALAPDGHKRSAQEILSAFGAKIEPIQSAPVYRLWVAIVAIVMVLLPLFYLGLIGLIAAGVYYHAVHDTWLVTVRGAHGSARRWAFAAYLAPIVAGPVVVAFMLKPLFARPVRDEKAKVLDPEDEPLLHAFVGAVCDAVGARRPSRIEIDCAINAGARRDGMFIGLFGNNLALRVGLPLVAGLTLRQFAGVLAHEFGHFSQGAGMRLSVLIMSVNAWFARVVYQRDSWDETLASWTRGDTSIQLFVGVIRLCVWLTRRILWVFMWAGHLVSMSLRRQMEYDADRYEARMVGGATFGATMTQLQVLNVASNGALSDLQTSWQERRMPDNYPNLVLANVPQIPAKIMADFQQKTDEGKTGWLDLYPCDKDRIAHAAAEEPGEGIFRLEGPATDVFRNCDELARVESLALYQSWLGPEFGEGQLYPVADLLSRQTALRETQEAADRLFLGSRVPIAQRLSIPDQYPSAPADVAAARDLLVRARADLEAARAQSHSATERLGKALGALFAGDYASICTSANLPFDAQALGLPDKTPGAVRSARDQAAADLQQIVLDCEPFANAASRRLATALAILEDDAVAAQVENGPERRAEAKKLYPCVMQLGTLAVALLSKVYTDQLVLSRIADGFQGATEEHVKVLSTALNRAAGKLGDSLLALKSKLGVAIRYPFDEPKGLASVSQYVLPAVPAKDNAAALLETSGMALNRMTAVYARALGHLALTVEAVERALGLPPIEFTPVEAGPVQAA
jgi:Zn-dependent protease with chaperone function